MPARPRIVTVVIGDLTRLQGDHVRAGRPDRQRSGDTGKNIGVVEMAVQKQHLDKRPRSIRVAGASGPPTTTPHARR